MLHENLLEIIKKGKGNSLVIGAPGSGKTHTLVELVRYLVNTEKVDPGKILIFCFNRRWSKSIREETASLIGRSIPEIPIETFHSFCTRFIAESKNFLYGAKPGNNNSSGDESQDNPFGGLEILNSVQQWDFLKGIIKKLEPKKYPRTLNYVSSNHFMESSFVQEVFDFILRAQENLITPSELSDKFTPFFNPLLSELTGIYSRYLKELRKYNFYNYGMLLTEAVDILKKHGEIRDYYKSRYEYIIVDELQEINKAQYEIINHISDSNCFFFGNDDQSIYAFRGSTLDIFKSVYSNLSSDNIHILRENHRSDGIIVEACSRFINLVGNRIQKEIPVSDYNGRGELQVKSFQTLLEEANFICNKINYLFFNRGVKLEEMAVIIKGSGYETHILESALLRNKIPFVRRGTRSLLDNGIVKYLLNLMRFMVALKGTESPEEEIDAGKSSEKESSSNGVTDKSYIKIDSILKEIMLSGTISIEPLFFKKMEDSYGCKNGSNAEGFNNLWEYFKSLSKIKKRKGNKNSVITKISDFTTAVNNLIKIMEESDAFEFLMVLIRDKKVGVLKKLTADGAGGADNKNDWNNLSDFLRNVKDFSSKNEQNGVESYINFIDNIIESKFTEEIEESTGDLVQPGSVNIMSFHQCKGLEFRTVFIPFINKNYIPAKLVSTQAFDMQIFNYLNGTGKLEPGELKREHLYGEMKLFYNGITRAKEYLYVTSSSRVKSIIFEEINAISGELNRGYKKLSSRIESANAKKRSKVESVSGDEDAGIRGIERMPYFDLNNLWLVRKRAMVAAYRAGRGLRFDSAGYMRNIAILSRFYHPQEWWNFIKPTENNKNPFDFIPVSFSHSSIGTYIDCPFKYKVRYFFDLEEEENLALRVGKIYHSIIREFFESKDGYSRDKLLKLVSEAFDRIDFGYEFVRRSLRSKALEQFENFFDNLMPENPDRAIVEKKFSFKLDGEKINGRIDQINIVDKDNIEIIDYKSVSGHYSDRELKEELQLKLYRMALDLSDDLKEFRGKNVKMKYISLGNIKKPVSTLPDEYYDSGALKEILKENISKIKIGKFGPEPKDYNSCLNCGFKVLCPDYYGKKD